MEYLYFYNNPEPLNANRKGFISIAKVEEKDKETYLSENPDAKEITEKKYNELSAVFNTFGTYKK